MSGLWTWDPETDVVTWSASVSALYGVATPVTTYDEQLAAKVPALKDHPLVDLPLYNRDVDPLFAELA